MWQNWLKEHRAALILIGLAGLGFVFGLGVPPLFDWDEINFAESAREMVATGDYFRVQINYKPFWEKPPLFFWLQAACMHVFGVGEFAARLPNALIGMLTLAVLYHNGAKWRGQSFGLLLAGVYVANMLPSLYFKSGIIDPTFNFFILMGLMEILRVEMGGPHPPTPSPNLPPFDSAQGPANSERGPSMSPKGITLGEPGEAKRALRAGLWIGIATLTKGPVALLVTIAIFGVYRLAFRRVIPWRAGFAFLGAWMVLVLGWYGVETLVHGPWFIQEFIKYQAELFTQPVASHGQPWFYHIVIYLAACFPMSAFTFRSMFAPSGNPADQVVRRFMAVWWWVVMIVFSAATTKIVHYASLLYVPGAVLMALYLSEKRRALTWDVWLLTLPGLLVWGVLPACINVVVKYLPTIETLVRDPLAKALMRQPVSWSGWEWMAGALFLLGSGYALWALRRGQVQRYVWVQAGTALISLNLLYTVVGPKAAGYTYDPPIHLFSEVSGKPIYVLSYNYKTYLHFFYGRIQPGGDPRQLEPEWLMHGEGVDRDVYLIAHTHRLKEDDFIRCCSHFEHVKDEGAYSLFVRRKGKE